jgi:hypothetical protein
MTRRLELAEAVWRNTQNPFITRIHMVKSGHPDTLMSGLLELFEHRPDLVTNSAADLSRILSDRFEWFETVSSGGEGKEVLIITSFHSLNRLEEQMPDCWRPMPFGMLRID